MQQPLLQYPSGSKSLWCLQQRLSNRADLCLWQVFVLLQRRTNFVWRSLCQYIDRHQKLWRLRQVLRKPRDLSKRSMSVLLSGRTDVWKHLGQWWNYRLRCARQRRCLCCALRVLSNGNPRNLLSSNGCCSRFEVYDQWSVFTAARVTFGSYLTRRGSICCGLAPALYFFFLDAQSSLSYL